MNKKTKEQLIRELHDCGETWADESYTKEYLEGYLARYKAASEMSPDDLLRKIIERKEKL